jgi:hypothetical protein
MQIRDGVSLPRPFIQQMIGQKAPWDNQINGIREGDRSVGSLYSRDGEVTPSQCVRSSYVPEVIQQ